MTGVWIAGVGMTAFGKDFRTAGELAADAVREALADAALEVAEVQSVFYGNAGAGLLEGQEMIRGQVTLQESGLLGRPIVNVENACASSSTAFQLAVTAVRSGDVDVAIAIGAERLLAASKSRVFGMMAAGTDLESDPEMREMVRRFTLEADPDDTEIPAQSPLMEHYAAKGRAYMRDFGATAEDFARVVVKSRRAAEFNPKAQFTRPTTVEEVLAARTVAAPLTVPMCSPLGNGAAAVIVVSDRIARRLGGLEVRVLSSVLASNSGSPELPPSRDAAHRAFERAAVDPADIDVAELHDASAPAELWIMESMGLCAPGEAVRLLRDGTTALGGSLPINPSGGLLSRGHPVGATGCAQLVELSNQLRGRCGPRQTDGARLALAENGGGVFLHDEAAVVVTLLERA